MNLKYNCQIDLKNCIDWQRSNAEKFKCLVEKKDQWYQKNHCDFWNSYYHDTFNLDTANDFGLSVWSVILNEQVYGVVKPSDKISWGFGVNKANFNNGNFGVNSDTGYNFTIEQARILLKMKAFTLHMSGKVHGVGVIGINESLQKILGTGKMSCIDNRDMTFTYIVYDDALSGLSTELYKRDLLPRPVGIDIKLVIRGNVKQWGFGPNRSNFNNGNFNAGVIIGN